MYTFALAALASMAAAVSAQSCSTVNASSTDTVASFLGNPYYDETAVAAPTPNGYTQSFQALNGSTSQGGYLTYYTLPTYSTYECASYCALAGDCEAFNIYFERDPSFTPCSPTSNPPSVVNIKCAIYSTDIYGDTATNKGQYQDAFEVAITGSNGYNVNLDDCFL